MTRNEEGFSYNVDYCASFFLKKNHKTKYKKSDTALTLFGDTSLRRPKEAILLQGFNPWQKYITITGVLGVGVAILGLVGLWLPVITSGFGLALVSLLVLVLLGNRQNWRLLKTVQHTTYQLTSGNTKPKNMMQELPKPIHVGSSFEYAGRLDVNPSTLESFTLRSKSLLIRDAFALSATANQYKFHELTQLIGTQRMRMLPEFKQPHAKHWNKATLLALARIQANQRATEYDLENSVRFFKFVQTFFGNKSLRRNDRLLFLEALGELGQYDAQLTLARSFKTTELFPVQAKLFELNAIQSATGANSQKWINRLNELFDDNNFAPVTLSEAKQSPLLDRLRTESTPIVGGPKVTIIVPTYQGGSALLHALQSLLDQSWQNTEIIVVDDGSGPEYTHFLDKAASLSQKIQILKQEQNLGAYCARNAGLSQATGDYITIHDDDDWSHGDKIAIQVQHLIDNPSVPGNMSAHVRATDDLKFVRINNNPILTQANFSSLMVHKSVFEKVGPWDNVNRGADSEFRDRIVQYFGKPVEVLIDAPLSFTRTWAGSLTSGEMSRGYVDPSRLLYLAAYTQHHKAVEGTPSQLRQKQPRPYPVPTTMEPGNRRKHLGRFDVVFMTDFRFPGGTSSLTLKEIQEASKAGFRVGYIQSDSPLNNPTTPISKTLFRFQFEGLVEQISLEDSADVDLLVIRHPSVVTYLDNASSDLKVTASVLIVNNPPVLPGGTGMVFDLSTCISNVDRLFEHKTQVIAESELTKTLCEAFVPAARLAKSTWPGVVPLSKPTPPDFDKKPTVGRHSRDHALKWPSSRETFKDAYSSRDFNTQILGGIDALKEKLGTDIAEGLTTYDFGEKDVHDFLSEVDFWVYFHDDQLTESFGMSIAEAMANGKVVVLPPYLESSFGTGALYAQPSDVSSLIREYWADPDSYSQQSQRAQEFVKQHFSPEALIERIDQLTEATHDKGQTNSSLS